LDVSEDSDFSRRKVFAAGAGVVLAAAFVGQAQAAEMSATDRANVDLVNDHMKGWGAADATGAKLAAAYADDCVLRIDETKPPLVGKAAAIALFDSFLGKGVRFDIRIDQTFARGPVVTNSRVDTQLIGGKPGKATPLVGVFIIRNGKIAEWSDYVIRA